MFLIRCCTCHQEKLEDDFSYKNKAQALRHTQCKSCSKAYCAEHYQRHVKLYKQRAVSNSIVRREVLHRRLHEFLVVHPCVDCGEDDPLVLELDHRDDVEKLHNLSKMWYNGYSWKKIEDEIAKCDVRCANCHRRRTARQQNWSNVFWDTLK
jgi:hypothetical protein